MNNNNYDNTNSMKKENLLFIHLLNHYHERNNDLVTISITEEGIRNSINCDLGYLSRILKKNEKDGLIYREKSRIMNKNKKQFAFFLTEKGLKLSKELSNMMKIL